MSRLALHVNAWAAEAKRTAEQTGTDLLVLNTAADEGPIREWRGRNPYKRLAYREVFENGYPDAGEAAVRARCDRLCEHADRLLKHGPIIALLPWNEERQADDLLDAYCEDSLLAISILRSRGYLTAAGGFSVGWPKVTGRAKYLPAWREADYAHLHTYGAPKVQSDYERHVGHAAETALWIQREAGKLTLLTEFGIDWGVLGYRLTGFHGDASQGVPATPLPAYCGQLREASLTLPRCVVSIFVYCFGGRLYGWPSFDAAGEPEVEALLREEYPVYQFVQGFKALAEAMRARGLDPGEPIEPEVPHAFADGFVVTRQRTSTGEFDWIKSVNQPLFSGQDGRLVLFNGGNLIVTVRGV